MSGGALECQIHHFDRVRSYCWRSCRDYPERWRRCDWCMARGFDVARGALKECYSCDAERCVCGACWRETAARELEHYLKKKVILACTECETLALCTQCWHGAELVCAVCRFHIIEREGLTRATLRYADPHIQKTARVLCAYFPLDVALKICAFTL